MVHRKISVEWVHQWYKLLPLYVEIFLYYNLYGYIIRIYLVLKICFYFYLLKLLCIFFFIELETFQQSHNHLDIERLLDTVNPYCNFCDKRYSTKATLKRHLEEKHFSKRYQCDICFKTFHRENYINTHKKMVHKNLDFDF